MKHRILNWKSVVLYLTVLLAICAIPDTGYGFFDDLIGVIGDVTDTVVTVAVANVAVGVADLTVRLALTLVGHTGCVLTTAFDPHGATMASGGCDHSVLLWDSFTGATTLTLRHLSAVHSLAYCAVDGCMLASGTEDGLLYLWNPGAGELKTRLTGHTGAILSTVFSPSDHHLLASGSADGTIRLWNADTGAHTKTLEGHTDSVSSLAFRLDGEVLASGSADGTIRLWDGGTGAHQRTLNGHTGTIGSLAFSFDGSVIASGSTDGSVRVWNSEDGEQLGTLDHRSPVLSVAFSAGDSLFASGSADGLTRLWDPLTWKVKATLGHESPVHSVSFSPDGGLLVTGAGDGDVRKWELTSIAAPFARDPAHDFASLGSARNTSPRASGPMGRPFGWRTAVTGNCTRTTWAPVRATLPGILTLWIGLETIIHGASGLTERQCGWLTAVT